MSKKSFRLEAKIKDTYSSEFKIPKTYEMFKTEYTENLKLGSSPFENRNQFKDFLKEYKFSDKTIDYIRSTYKYDRKYEDSIIKQMEFRARAVIEGGYQYTKAKIYKKNLIKALKENNDLSAVVDYRFFAQGQGDEKELTRMEPITLGDFVEIINAMSLKEIDELSKAGDIVPDFRAFGSKQEAVRGDNIANISLFISMIKETSHIDIFRKYNPKKVLKIKQDSIFYQTLPVEVKRWKTHFPNTSRHALEMEKYWTLFKKDKLYNVTLSGRAYIPFVSKSKEKEIMDFIAKRLHK